MGNCGSSLNCTQCYGEEDGCVDKIEVDPDIAGIGVRKIIDHLNGRLTRHR